LKNKLYSVVALALLALTIAPAVHAQTVTWDDKRLSSAVALCGQGALTATQASAQSNLNDICWTRSAAGVFKATTNDLTTKAAIDAKVALTSTSSVPISGSLGAYQGTTAVGITTANFTALVAAASDITIPANASGVAGKKIKIHASGVYTDAAASVLNAEIMLCTVSGCGSGTVVAPAGCAVTTTNQANVLTNGQWSIDCYLTTTATVGASGTYMAKGLVGANLGATTGAVQSFFQDTAVAVSAAVDQTVPEFINVAFKFTTSNASNFATADELSAEISN
jgi:hypothetical protein